MVHLKYPSMERQDLSQAQLGSFKFTPVDEATYNTTHSAHPLLLEQYAHSLRNGGLLNKSACSTDVQAPSFFDKAIKPSLEDSRLRLGPAGIRAAVQTASPNKKHSQLRSSSPAYATAQNFKPSFLRSSDESSSTVFTNGYSDNSSLGGGIQMAHPNDSLLRALESEQDLHHNTRLALEDESAKRLGLQNENKALQDHNRSLLSSVNMLKSTLKHMVEQQDKLKEKMNSPKAEPHHVNAKAKDTNGLLYDILKAYKVPRTITNSAGEEDTKLFDLDLLSTPDKDDRSEQANLQRTLRRQLGVTPAVVEHVDPNSAYQQKIASIVRQTSDTGIGEELIPVTSTLIGSHDEKPQPVREDRMDSVVSVRTTVDDTTTHGFPYSLPASFIAKYCGKGMISKPETRPARTDNMITGSINRENSLSQPALKIERSDKTEPGIFMPDRCTIDWKIDERDDEDLIGKRYIEMPRGGSHFTAHPVRYVPNMGDQNVFRTVMIDFIPMGATYAELLKVIRGGTIQSIQMYGPIGSATDFCSARVVFVLESSANTLYKRGQNPGIEIQGQKVRVWIVNEPTCPSNASLERVIHEDEHTRMLVINTDQKDITPVLKRKLYTQIGYGAVLNIGRSSVDGVPRVEFVSIDEATKALQKFMNDPDLASAQFDFDEDECARPYEE